MRRNPLSACLEENGPPALTKLLEPRQRGGWAVIVTVTTHCKMHKMVKTAKMARNAPKPAKITPKWLKVA